ncbi:MAG: PAS domain S-box protein, partial [Thermodesulfobacteriota bacterium]
MDNCDAVSGNEVLRLRERIETLAKEKSHLQLVSDILTGLAGVSGLDNMAAHAISTIMEAIGGSNVILYYRFDDNWYCSDVNQTTRQIEKIESALVNRALSTHQFVESSGTDHQTQISINGIRPSTKAWAFPLIAGDDLIGAVEMQGIFFDYTEDIKNELHIIINYLSLALNNEIVNSGRLKLAYDALKTESRKLAEEVSERRRTEEALRESEIKFRELVEDLNEVIYSIDANGLITYISPALEKNIGYAPKDVIGRHFLDFVHPEDQAGVKERLQQVFFGQLEPYEYRLLTKSGQIRWIRSSSKPIIDDDQAVGLRGVFSDITEEKRLHANLQQTQKMEAIGTLAGGIAHDFNNILSSVIGYTELALLDAPADTVLQKNMSEVLAAGNRAKALVKQILAISRNEESLKKPVQINLLIKEALKMLRSTMPSSIDFHENIPCDDPLTVQANPTHIHQVIVNLATNAMHAMTDREGMIEVRLDSVCIDDSMKNRSLALGPGSYARLIVSDTGTGIAASDLEKIFEPYFTTKQKGDGTGLGLSIVHNIVKSHNGHISVYSLPGKGTT